MKIILFNIFIIISLVTYSQTTVAPKDTIAAKIVVIDSTTGKVTQEFTDYTFTKFSQTIDLKSIYANGKKAMPTNLDCPNIILNVEDSKHFYNYIKDVKSTYPVITAEENKKFADIKTTIYTSNDFKDIELKADPSMSEIIDRFKPGIVFVKVSYYKIKDSKKGMLEYKYWAFYNGKWLFLPEPWNAF